MRPSRNFYHDFQEFLDHSSSSIDHYPGAYINIRSNLHIKENQPFINKIVPLFNMLNIDCSEITPNTFFKNPKFITQSRFNENILDIGELFVIMGLFSRIKFIELQQIGNHSVEEIISCTLWKIEIANNYHTKTICVNANEESQDKLESLPEMIDSENFLKDFIMYRR
ncbi:hypothetical protein I4U23_024173 [Adineta vaga]|nr:hypothetical protein I4U23_024173 [Adineta vaga]